MGKTPKKEKKGKLPSGNVRVQVYDYTDDSGKRHYKSFTAATRKEAKALADKWRLTREEHVRTADNMTVYEVVERYIELKGNALSPATITGYSSYLKNYFSGKLGKKKMNEISSSDVQLWISELGRKNLSPKTIKNVYGLLSASLEMFAPDLHIKVTLPARIRPNLYCPNDNDIKKLLKEAAGTELEIAILLAAFGPLRRGEICAIDSNDIAGNIIKVSKSKVLGPDGEWHIKQPKTYGSYREVEFPAFVMDKIRYIRGPIVKTTPNGITKAFDRAVKKSGVPHFRFHDLRHYSASIMHAIGVPDQYILQRGGWISDNVMKSVYRNVIDIESERQNKKINKHFEAMSKT